MTKITLLIISILFLSGSSYGIPRPPRKYQSVQKYMDDATKNKLVGVVVYIQSPKHGEWIGTSGYSNLEMKQSIRQDQTFSLASIGKMYNAVAILKLAEEGKLKLDDKISQYLSSEITDNIPNAKEVTIRHLLGHQSGFFNYEHDSILVDLYTTGRLKLDTLSRINALRRYVFGKATLFKPGTKFDYSSTNYLLLAMIGDKVVSVGHATYLRQLVSKHGFLNTYYLQTPPKGNVSYYGDLNKDDIVENLTSQTFETTNWFSGDDGVYAPIEEAAHFLQQLMKGEILNQESLRQMKKWNDDESPDYGLGLMADKSFPYGFLLGHSGRGIGITTDLYYFPKQDMTVAIFCNTGLRNAAPGFRREYNKMRTRIVKKLFLF